MNYRSALLTRCFFILAPLLLAGELSFSQEHPTHNFDLIGDLRHSRYNFTDAVIPYYGVDGWTELKFTCWTDTSRTLASYASLLGSGMFYFPQASDDIRRFDWQRYVQAGLGIQWYPFEGDFIKAIRVFAFGAGRLYHQQEAEAVPYSDLVGHDLHIGADYYYDNLFSKGRSALVAWSNFTFRSTNFSRKQFHAFLWTGNVKFGRKWEPSRQSIFFPYLVLDWTTTFPRRHRWWENYVHAGGGLRCYPFAWKKDLEERKKKENKEGIRRLHLYAEWLWEGKWLRDEPPGRMKPWDLRFGIGFSTPGFFRNEDKNEDKAETR